jgi:hypothetical protein
MAVVQVLPASEPSEPEGEHDKQDADHDGVRAYPERYSERPRTQSNYSAESVTADLR